MSVPHKLSRQQADEAWKIIVSECGARDDADDRLMYTRYFMNPKIGLHEWRFQGSLGFGGKLYLNGSGLYVACYPEDETPARRQMIDKANERLASLIS